MHRSTVFILVCTIFFVAIDYVSSIYICDVNTACPIGSEFNLIECKCVQRINNLRKKRWTNSETRREITNESFNRRSNGCSNNERWNGSDCVAKSTTLCSGGYHWNGNACIMQLTYETSAFLRSPPDLECKHAQKLRDLATENRLPARVMPIYSTSPSCPFGSILSDDNECVKQLPTCPYGYFYNNNGCQLRSKPIAQSNVDDTESQLITTAPIKHDPDRIPVSEVINDNKWLQKPVFSTVEPELSYSEYDTSRLPAQNKNEHCCQVISPRICQRFTNGSKTQWRCFNKNYRRCGSVCTKPIIQLRQRLSSFVDSILVMPPPPKRLLKLIRRHPSTSTPSSQINIGQ